MDKKFSAKFIGISRKEYNFDFYDLNLEWSEVAGIYLMAKYDQASNTIYAIYVGETDNLKNRLSNHHKQSCFDRYGVNVLGWIGEGNSHSRLNIESDLIQGIKPPCNE